MSLEDALKANTAAVLSHNTLLEKMLAGSKPAGAAPATKPAGAAAAPATKPTSKPAVKKKAETTSEHVAERVKAYLKGGSESERAARKGHVKAIIDFYGSDRFTSIDPASYDEALGYLDQFEAGEDPFSEGDEADADGTDGDDDGVV